MKDNVKESELSAPEEIKSFRADAASGNYLSMDKPDVQFSAKKISRAMSKPTRKEQRKIVRMAKLLKDPGNRRVQQVFKFETSDTYADSDWAGCRYSRKRTSGGVVSTNIGVVKHWSSTQRLGHPWARRTQ